MKKKRRSQKRFTAKYDVCDSVGLALGGISTILVAILDEIRGRRQNPQFTRPQNQGIEMWRTRHAEMKAELALIERKIAGL